MRYRGWALVALTAHLLSASSLQAQWWGVGGAGGGDMRGGGGMPGGGPGAGGRGGMMGRPPGHPMEFPTPEELEGPLTPAAMSRVADLDSAGTARYAERHAAHMAATAPARDSLRLILRSLREERVPGDPDEMRSEMRERGAVVSSLWKDVSKRDKRFYKDVTKAFTKDERKKFEKWQDEKKKAHEAERRRGPGGAERPGWT